MTLALYRPGAVGGASGGAGALGEATIWPDVATSADLATIANPRTGDECTTTDTGFVWQYTGAAWEIVYGTVATAASLPSASVSGSALFGVGSDGIHQRTWYGRDASAWVRTPNAAPYGRALSSLQDVLSSDFDGDFGVYTNAVSGVRVTFRLRTVTVSVGAGGGTRRVWIPPSLYDESGLTIAAYLTGSENATARAARGWTDVLSAGGTRSITGNQGSSGETLLSAQFSGGQAGTAQLACGLSSMAAGTRVYWRAVLRGDCQNGAGAEASVRFAGDGVNFNWLQQRGSGGAVRLTDQANTGVDASSAPNGAGTAWASVSSTAECWEGWDFGRTINSRVHRAGNPYTSGRRPLAITAVNNVLRFAVGGGAGTEIGQLRVSFVEVLTW